MSEIDQVSKPKKSKSLAIGLIVLVIAIRVILSFFSSSPGELNAIAQIYLTGDHTTALSMMDAYLAEHPEDVQAYTIKGNILSDIDRDQEAESAYLKAIEIDPDTFQAVNGLGVIHRRRGELDTAKEFYLRALDLEPDYAQALSSLAIIELMQENDTEALELARNAFKYDQEDPVIAANLAVICHYCDRLEERNTYARRAETLGYPNIDGLQQIFSGELSIR